MKVSQLIERLKNEDQEAVVRFHFGDTRNQIIHEVKKGPEGTWPCGKRKPYLEVEIGPLHS